MELFINRRYNIDKAYNYNIIHTNFAYFDTSNLGFSDTTPTDSHSLYNFGESLFVNHICHELFNDCDDLCLKTSDIGVITPYISQRNKIVREFSFSRNRSIKNIEVSTIDGYQGKEKKIIIISLVRSRKTNTDNEINNNSNTSLRFMEDLRRMNVMITRAQYLIIIIGDFSFFSQEVNYNEYLEYVKLNGYDLKDEYFPDNRLNTYKGRFGYHINSLRNRLRLRSNN
jgi:superfamily I DNA and/or RNA helicase